METRTVELTLEMAKMMYKWGGRQKELALEVYTVDELDDYTAEVRAKRDELIKKLPEGSLFVKDGDTNKSLYILESYPSTKTNDEKCFLANVYKIEQGDDVDERVIFKYQRIYLFPGSETYSVIDPTQATQYFQSIVDINISKLDDEIEMIKNIKKRYKYIRENSSEILLHKIVSRINGIKEKKQK